MKRLLAITFILFVQIPGMARPTPGKTQVNIPTVGQEATVVWNTINDITFFKKQGYKINLPNNKLIDSLVVKSEHGDFGNADYALIYELLEQKVYKTPDYTLALEKVKAQEQLLNRIIQRLDSLSATWDWKFNIPEKYNVVLTLYGSGGSYDPQTGTITLFATSNGDFKNYANPVNTIVHEMVHLGIENSIIQHYHISHSLKEQIVDRLVSILFGEVLPEYHAQNFGPFVLDNQLKSSNDVENLNRIIERIINQ